MKSLCNALLTLCLCLPEIRAFVYPPADETDWERIQVYRERHNITFNYHPKHIHPEYCRFLSEDECAKEDEAAFQALQVKKERRRLSDSIGTLRALVLLVQFPEHTNRTLPPKEHFEELCNGNSGTTINPIGSLKQYFDEQSYGKYNVVCDVMDWHTTNNTEASYAQGQSGLLGSAESQKFFHPVLDVVDQEQIAKEGPNWLEKYDKNNDGEGDGMIDALVVIHSGYAAQKGATSCDGATRADRFWSQGHVGSNGGGWLSQDYFEVGGYVIDSAFAENCDSTPAKIGVIAHEWIHTFGVPDLYDPNLSGNRGTAGFDIMAITWGQGNNEAAPGSLSPWSKMQIGWANPTEITEDGSHTISASATSDSYYIIRANFPDKEYLLIENRQPVRFDSYLWGNGGIVIYHIDDTIESIDMTVNRERGFPGQPGWPQNGKHYRVAVLQADGRYDIEQNRNDGDEDDFWLNGMSLGPGSTGIHPNTDSYQFGSISSTGITITVTSDSAGTMSFSVTGLSLEQNQEKTEEPTPAPTSPESTLAPTDVPIDGNSLSSYATSVQVGLVTTMAMLLAVLVAE